ncbi:class I tRNA ligase family protein [Thermogymnomonas acidicola]|uniref:class I tRNA ligase family protein n=1 Tax=Thermogymnomonas acidicola TaxID=399579 RepID=UPI00094644BC|nr:class I tRNA ligase family protein [Thermogymnomonas acidicola]
MWFEALIGYISAARILSERRGKPDLWKEYYMDPEARVYYFIGKDNIPFHTIIWPAMLMAKGGINLPYDVPANEYLRFRGPAVFQEQGGHRLHGARGPERGAQGLPEVLHGNDAA